MDPHRVQSAVSDTVLHSAIQDVLALGDVSRSFCCIMLKPDVVLRQSVRQVLAFFEESGLAVIEHQIGMLPTRVYSIMHAQDFQWKLDYWAHNFQAYKFAPVIVLLFWNSHTRIAPPNTQSYFASIKGSALPWRLGPETIRGKLGVSSRVYNLIHIADNTAGALREACAWFGIDQVYRLLADATRAVCTTGYAERIAQEIATHGYLLDRALDGEASFVFIKLRTLHVARRKLFPLTARTLQLCEALCAHYTKISGALLAPHLERDSRATMLASAHAQENTILRACVAEVQSATTACLDAALFCQLLEVLIFLNARHKPMESAVEFMWYVLEQWDVFVSELEQYLIKTSLLYGP